MGLQPQPSPKILKDVALNRI